MKHMKVLNANGKTNDMAAKQAKRWFKMNPNRKIVNMKVSPTYFITFKREDVVK